MDRIFEFDFFTGRIKVIFKFSASLLKQPEFFLLDDQQVCAVIASQQDCVYVDFRTDAELDLD